MTSLVDCTTLSAALLLLPAAAVTADSTDTGQVVLQLKFTPNETVHYQTELRSRSGPASAAAGQANGTVGSTSFAEKVVQEVKVRRIDKGAITMDLLTSGQKALPGQPAIFPTDGRPVTLTYDSLGKLTAVRRAGDSTAAAPMLGPVVGPGLLSLQGLSLPGKPVRVGESWSSKFTLPALIGGGAMTAKGTLTRIAMVDKYRVAKLHVVRSTPILAYVDAAVQPTLRAESAAGTFKGAVTVTDDIDFAITEGRVIRASSRSNMEVSLFVGKPTPPARPGKGRKSAAPVPPASPPQPAMKMAVRTEVDSTLLEEKRVPGAP